MAFYISDENGNLIKYAGLGNGGSIDPSLLDNLVKIDDVQNKQLYVRNNQGVVTGISYDVNPTENSFPTRGVGAVLKVGTPQSDEDAATKAYVDGVINSINEFNPNLLINGDFRVNQRGQEEYGNATQYTVDRWQLTTQTNANLSFNVTTKTLSNTGTSWGYFVQRIESNDVAKIWGKTWTFSAKVNGNIYSKTFTAPSTAPTTSQGIAPTLICIQNLCQVRLYYYNNSGTIGFTFDIHTGSVTLEYAKLELGSVATPFSPRPYAEELALCQRYYEKIDITNTSNKYQIRLWARSAYFFYDGKIPFMVEKRVLPTIKVYSQNTDTQGYLYDITQSKDVEIVLSYYTTQNFLISVTAGDVSANDICAGYFEADAEIY